MIIDQSISGSLTSGQFTDSANSAYILDPANTGNSLLVAGNIGIGTTAPAGILHVIAPTGVLTDNIPAMTTNTTPSPLVASQSSLYAAGYGGYGAFDKVANTWGWLSGGVTTGWVKLDLGSGQGRTIKQYKLVGPITDYATRGPKTWTFQGSNDDSSWTTLDTQTNVASWGVLEERTYVVSNSTSYRYYKIDITANQGDPSYLTFTEMYIYDLVYTNVAITSTGNVGIGTTAPETQVQISGGGLCVGSNTNCNTDNNTQGVIYSSSTAMTAYDVAEKYPTKDTTLVQTEVVELDPKNGVFVRRSSPSAAYNKQIVGIISTDPGVLLGGFNGPQFKGEHQVAVTLSGRVPVKIAPDSQDIDIGDFLTSSDSHPGMAMKATRAGYTIGKALESWQSGGPAMIEVFVNLGYNMGPTEQNIKELQEENKKLQVRVSKLEETLIRFIQYGTNTPAPNR